MAGTVGAIANNGIGVRGVAPGASLCPVKVLDDTGNATWAQVIAGIDYVTGRKAEFNDGGGGGGSLSRYFDGSDVGLSSLKLDAFAVISADEILMSFTNAGSVPGVAGTVDDADIVLFTATSLGETTAGSFSLYFDGSDVGLSKRSEDIDGIELLENGNLLISTLGSFSVSGASGKDEDILEFTPTSLGANTSGSWAVYFDGSDMGLGGGGEDVDAMGLDATGKIYLSTVGSFTTNGLSGADEDVFGFTPTSLGSTTAGSFDAALYFDGSLFGLGLNDLYAIDLP